MPGRSNHFILLTADQAALAAHRYEDHGNSPSRIARHFRNAEDESNLRLCRAIRRLERRFEIDLGAVCFKFLEKETRPTPQVQREVMDYVARWRERGDGRDLLVSVDRVREIARLAEGERPEWASSADS